MTRTPVNSPTEGDNHPLKVCVVTDNNASARSAMRMIQRVSKATNLRLTLLHLDELASPSNGDSLPPLDSELFIIATSHGGELPGVARTWIEDWAYLRGEGHDCALVALVTNESSSLDSRSPLVAYLGALAAAHGLAFFHGKAQGSANFDSPQPLARATASKTMQRPIANPGHVAQRWGINE